MSRVNRIKVSLIFLWYSYSRSFIGSVCELLHSFWNKYRGEEFQFSCYNTLFYSILLDLLCSYSLLLFDLLEYYYMIRYTLSICLMGRVIIIKFYLILLCCIYRPCFLGIVSGASHTDVSTGLQIEGRHNLIFSTI